MEYTWKRWIPIKIIIIIIINSHISNETAFYGPIRTVYFPSQIFARKASPVPSQYHWLAALLSLCVCLSLFSLSLFSAGGPSPTLFIVYHPPSLSFPSHLLGSLFFPSLSPAFILNIYYAPGSLNHPGYYSSGLTGVSRNPCGLLAPRMCWLFYFFFFSFEEHPFLSPRRFAPATRFPRNLKLEPPTRSQSWLLVVGATSTALGRIVARYALFSIFLLWFTLCLPFSILFILDRSTRSFYFTLLFGPKPDLISPILVFQSQVRSLSPLSHTYQWTTLSL